MHLRFAKVFYELEFDVQYTEAEPSERVMWLALRDGAEFLVFTRSLKMSLIGRGVKSSSVASEPQIVERFWRMQCRVLSDLKPIFECYV